jgi:hypothetical protein
MTFWRLMVYALYVFVGLVLVFALLPKVFGLTHRESKPKKEQGRR